MAGESQNWVLMVTAQTPTNISVIKYWGKRDETLILPLNDSISVTFDPSHLCTTTTVAASPSFQQDRMWLNGKEISLSGGRFQSCLREIRNRACDVEDKKKGIKITKEDWGQLHLHIASYNNFPTAAGLASSAAGFACLVYALGKLMNVKEDESQLSAIARQGSGSACRSLFGGFVKWTMGKEEDGSDSLAVQLADEKHWDDLVIVIAVVSSQQKETSSTTGMRESVETSLLLQHRAKEVVPKRILQMEEAIRNRDFASFSRLTCTDSNQFHAVCLDTCPPIFYMNDTSHRIISIIEKWNHSEESPQVAYTFDAGPNAVLIARNRKTAALLIQRLLYYFPPNSDDLNSYIIGDKSLAKDAGINGIQDVEALPPPPEIKDNIPSQKFKGDVSYFICTRPGRGPVLLSDGSQALLNGENGLPNMALEVFNEMISHQCKPNICTYTALVNAFAREGLCEKAEEIFEQMQEYGLEPDVYAYNALMEAYSRAGFPYGAAEIFSLMRYMGCEPDRASYNILVDAYGKAGFQNDAEAVFEDMKRVGITPTMKSHMVLLSAYSRMGSVSKCEDILNQMCKSGLKLDTYVLNSMLNLYGRLGQFGKMEEVMTMMEKGSYVADISTYNILINRYGQAGFIQRMEELFQMLPCKGLKPDVVTWTSRIGAYSKKKLYVRCLEIFEEMIDAGCYPDGGTAKVLLAACSNEGQTQQVTTVIRTMHKDMNTVLPV